MKKLFLICSAVATAVTVSSCAIFDDDDDHHEAAVTTTTTEETHTVHTAPSVGVTTQTVSPAY